ncbi:MAG TPA: hypothetical protein PKD67_11960 [Ignavibacteriaceae bacterium]|jgi:NO-binding membrane sensor protein with MHYT domain|nr:hypothetical protein [Ignavibacteriaceae bacterium]
MKNYDLLTTLIGVVVAIGSSVGQYIDSLNGNPWNWGTFFMGIGVAVIGFFTNKHKEK